MALASVPVPRGSASIWTSIPSASALSMSSRSTTGFTLAPRAIAGPPSRLTSPAVTLLTLGWVGGVGHVNRHADQRIDSKRARRGAAQP